MRAAPGVPGIGAGQDGRERELCGIIGREVLRRVDGDVDQLAAKSLLELGAEDPAPAELGEAVPPIAVADRRERHDRHGAESRRAQRVRSEPGLAEREARPARP